MNFLKKKNRETLQQVDESYNSYLSAPDGEIIEKASGRDILKTLGHTTGGGVKFVVGILLLIAFVIGTTYTLLGGTLMFLAPTDQSSEKTWVARGTFAGGKVPEGSTVYASTTKPAPEKFFGKILESYTGAPDSVIAKSIAGPVVEVSNNKQGFITVNGKATKYKGNIQKTRLSNEYLMQCVSGSCNKGEYIVVPFEAISGEVRGTVGLSGVKTFHE